MSDAASDDDLASQDWPCLVVGSELVHFDGMIVVVSDRTRSKPLGGRIFALSGRLGPIVASGTVLLWPLPLLEQAMRIMLVE